MNFFKIKDEKRTFQSSRTKTEFHAKFRDENNNLIFILWVKLRYNFLKLGILCSPIKFKHMVALTNETQTMLSFPRIFKFNVFEFN